MLITIANSQLSVVLKALFLFFLFTLLSACSGGGGGNPTTHSISGTVSGLAGALVLQNNAGDDLTLNSDSNFTFGTQILEGGSYLISVSSQPSGQTCTVSNGVGSANSAITNITVTCLSYVDIGGTVSGLAGALVLQNNAGDDLTLNSDGNFTFGTQILKGGSYLISVSSQPSGQICTVSNGVGSANSSITNISVVCGVPFSLSGTVTGLSGTLVLQNNSVDNLTLTSNGSFTFVTQVAQSSGYDVSVFSDPGNQQCSVINGSGTVTGDVSNVQLSCVDLVSLTGRLGEGRPVDTAIQGNYAYVASHGGLLVLDISNPASPSSVAFYDVSTSAVSVKLSGNYAYVLGTNGLSILNISNPAAAFEVGSTNFSGGRDLAVSGNYAYLVGLSSIRIIDISNPATPTEVGSLFVNGWLYGVSVSGGYAYVADYLNGLRIIDISNPANPTEVSLLTIQYPSNVTVSGGYAYVASANGTFIVDISNPASPTQVGSSTKRAEDISVSGNYAYLAALSSGLVVLDISDPSAPTEVSSYRTSDWFGNVAVNGSYAYLIPYSDVGTDISIINISAPASPVLAGTYAVNKKYLASPESMVVNGGYAYVANRGGLTIVSVSDPTAPSHTAAFSESGFYYDVAVNGDYAYVAHGLGINIVNISNPAMPTIAGVLNGTGWLYGVSVSGGYAYVADHLNGLRIIDISNPTNPSLVSLLEIQNADSLAVANGYVYLLDIFGDMHIIDISNPTAPNEVGTIIFTNDANHVVMAGGYAYVATGSGLDILDISNPAVPVGVATLNTGSANHLALSGRYVYLTNATGGVFIVDISNPATPVEVANQKTVGLATTVSVVGDHVYVSEYGFGLEIFQTFLP